MNSSDIEVVPRIAPIKPQSVDNNVGTSLELVSSVWKSVAIASIVGLIICVGFIIVYKYFSTENKSSKENLEENKTPTPNKKKDKNKSKKQQQPPTEKVVEEEESDSDEPKKPVETPPPPPTDAKALAEIVRRGKEAQEKHN